MLEEQKQNIREIIELFDRAEDKVKEIEQLDQEISIPSINELRYVGYHLARLFCEEDPQEIDTQIIKAKNHCQRAIYDAHEIGIIYMLEQIKFFKETYLSSINFVIEVLPDYADSLRIAQESSVFIAKIKEHHRENRDIYYEECQPHYASLRKVFDTFILAKPLIEQKKIAANKNDKKETRRFVINVLLIILGIIVAIIIGFFSIVN